jgi:hypothetical protein
LLFYLILNLLSDNNFGEIEMCLNEKLSYNIKVKSRNCELFVLKKNDFLRLSVNFKEFIEKFLQKSLMKYLRFNEEKKKILKSGEDRNNGIEGLKNLNSQSKTGKLNNLEMIDEEKEEEVSEEYNVNEGTNSDESEQDIKDSSENEDKNYNKESENEEDEDKSSNTDNDENENINSKKQNANINPTTNNGNNNMNASEEENEPKKGTILRSLMNNRKSAENVLQNNKSSRESI